MADPSDRTPPANPSAEASVLGSMLLDLDAAALAAEHLSPEDFYDPRNRTIFEAARRLLAGDGAVDAVLLREELDRRDDVEKAGGSAHIAEVLRSVPTAANVEHYVRIVRQKAMLRSLITTATDIIHDAYETDAPAEEFIDVAEGRFFEATERRMSSRTTHIQDVLQETFTLLSEQDESLRGFPTGYPDLDDVIGGLRGSDLTILAARPAMGKCVAHDTEILLEDGSLRTIEEICERGEARLLTLGDDWKLAPIEPSAYVDDGLKPVYRVETRLGRVVETTLSHPFRRLDGWTPLADLSVGDRVAVPRRLPVFGSKRMRSCELKLLAYLIGDGGLTGACPRFTDGNERIAEDFRSAEPASTKTVPAVTGLQTAKKEVPAEVFRLERDQLALVLRELWEASGWVRVAGDGTVEAALVLETRRLASQVQHLLLRFGIIASIEKHAEALADGTAEEWHLEIIERESLSVFLEDIGDHETEAVAEARGALADPHLEDLAASDVYWDEVVSIEPVGHKQVYDLTIPETHNFVAGDVCVHNTTLALNIMRHAAVELEKASLFFSMEMSSRQVTQNLLCGLAQVDASAMRKGFISDRDWSNLADAGNVLHDAPIFIDDTPGMSLLEVRGKARRMKTRHDIGLILVDYLQLMETSGRSSDNRATEIGRISRGLKGIARELDVPLISLSQLNRGPEQRESHRPRLSDLRESGAIEQDADIILMLYRDEYYHPDTADERGTQGVAEVLVTKNRHGPTGTIKLTFRGEVLRFESFASPGP